MKLNFTHKKWHHFLLLLFIFGFANQASALTFWVKSGLTGTAGAPLAWNTAGNWTTTSPNSTVAATQIPAAGDTVNILTGKYVSIPLGVTGVCSVLNVIGANANLYIQGTSRLNCTTININTGGNITMTASHPSSNVITCSGTINCGDSTLTTAAGKGTLTVANGSAVSCGKLALGAGTSTNASTIPGRVGSSTFTFTGSGTDVIPVITTGVSSTTPVFASVIFNPGAGNTITIPAGFCSLAMSITSGTVDFASNYSTVFTATSGSLNMEAFTTLKIGGDKQVPNMATNLFNDTSTINFTGSTQVIRGILSGYKNLTLSGAGLKTLSGDVTVKLTLSIGDGTILDLAGYNLTLSGNYVNGSYASGNYVKGTGCIRSSSASEIWYRGYSNSSMQFDQTTPGTTNVVKNLTMGDLPGNIGATTPTDINPLNLTIESPLNITGTVNFIAGHLVSNGNVTFKSDASTTAFVGPITDETYCGIIGNVNIERFIPAGNRAYRPLSSSVIGASIFNSWQEGGSVASLTGSVLGNTLYTTNPSTPLVVGQHISGNLIPANTTISDISLAPNYQLSISQNTSSSIAMIAYSNISSSTIEARFMGHITNNLLTVDSFTQGTALQVGQKITAGGLVLANTVITEKYAGNSSYKIGLEIPSETMYYNGAPSGYGTHVTGVASTDAKLGQNDAATGLDYTRSGNPSLFKYNNGWTPVLNTKNEILTAGQPYLMMIRGDRTVDLALNSTTPTATTLRSTGTIAAGVVAPSLNTTPGAFNYIGNPYQAPVDLALVFADNLRWADLGASYTVFDPTVSAHGAYVTYDFDLTTNSISGDTDPSSLTSVASSILQPNQAFFVTTQTGEGTALVFNETDKATTDNTYVPMFRKAQTKNTNSLIRGSIFNSAAPTKGLDGFILAFSDAYDNAIVAEDTKKPTGNPDETIASKNGANAMAIDKRNVPAENDEIALNISQYRATDYTLKFNVSNFDAREAILVDTYTAKQTPLTNNQVNAYSFTVDTAIPATTAANRFKIIFKTAASLSTKANTITQLTVYPNPVTENKFTIKASQNFSGKKAAITILNTLGQKAYATNTTFSSDASIVVNPTNKLNSGIYVLKVTVDGKVETQKLIIK